MVVGLGWDARTTTGTDFDLDASAIMLTPDGKVPSDQHFIFVNNRMSPDGSVEHTGDNLTGEGDGDDESITVDLAAVPGDLLVAGDLGAVGLVHDPDEGAPHLAEALLPGVRLVDADREHDLVGIGETRACCDSQGSLVRPLTLALAACAGQRSCPRRGTASHLRACRRSRDSALGPHS